MVAGTHFSGPASSFPGMEQWKNFDELFNANKSEMLTAGSTPGDVEGIKKAVQECAKLGVDERVIFCIIMQESSGNVGIGTTTNMDQRSTGGLMQCDGSPAFPGKHDLSQVCSRWTPTLPLIGCPSNICIQSG
jgi:hypothetical protein